MYKVNTIHGEDIIATIIDKKRIKNTKYAVAFGGTKIANRRYE